MSFIDSYVNGCIPPLMNTPASTSSNCCITSPITFIYNFNTSNLLFNNFVNQSTSPNPGVTSNTIYKLQSPDTFLQGVDLVVSSLVNTAAPNPSITTQLYIFNSILTASDKNGNTLGTLNFQFAFANPVPTKDQPKIKYRVRQLTSYVSSSCGIFTSYNGGKVIINIDDNTNNRTILVYRDKE